MGKKGNEKTREKHTTTTTQNTTLFVGLRLWQYCCCRYIIQDMAALLMHGAGGKRRGKLGEKRDEKMKRMRGKEDKKERQRKAVRARVCAFRGLKAETGEN